jgi:hypothetical protein
MAARLLSLTALILSACASEAPPQPVSSEPLEQKGQRVVATVDGRAITEADVQASSLGALIVQPLLDRYRAERGIAASREEIEACLRRAFGANPSDEAARAVLVGDDQTTGLATHLVLDWKTSKQLYAEYGGVVVFQQLNPLEPLGAYRAFLREQESRGAFCIHEPESAAAFWAYFERDPGRWKVAAEDVDYSVPWWEKVAKPARGVDKR